MASIDRFLSRGIKRGTLTLTDSNGTRTFGTRRSRVGPILPMRFGDAGVGRYIATHPRLGAAEAFMDGRLVIERGDIMDLLSLLRRNNRWDKGGEIKDASALSRGFNVAEGHGCRGSIGSASPGPMSRIITTSTNGSTASSLMPTCSTAALTTPIRPTASNRHRRTRKPTSPPSSRSKPGHRVLDIGCGWGGMALYLHQKTGAEVSGRDPQRRTTPRRPRPRDRGGRQPTRSSSS